jgi:hypothetical protein
LSANYKATFNKLNFLFQRDQMAQEEEMKTIIPKGKEIFGVVHYGTQGK